MKTIILDGSNIVRNMYNTQNGLDFAKEQELADSLVRAVAYLNEPDAWRVEIYFDGPKREIYRPGELVEVFFSKHKKADDLIVNSAEELQEMSGQEVLIVTQDRQLGIRCQSYGAQILSARDFLSRCYDYIDEFARA